MNLGFRTTSICFDESMLVHYGALFLVWALVPS